MERVVVLGLAVAALKDPSTVLVLHAYTARMDNIRAYDSTTQKNESAAGPKQNSTQEMPDTTRYSSTPSRLLSVG